MQISTEQHYKVVLEEPDVTLITLVGVGGTGSALAVDLARLLYHCRQQGKEIYLQLVDHDHVEPKNVGRQQFSMAEIGQNKAVSMARRLNAWLGLDVIALPEAFDAETELIRAPFFEYGRSVRRILVGAVDNWRARRELAEVAAIKTNIWWVDCGNGEYTGQILVGNLDDHNRHLPIDDDFCIVDGLPSPALQMPELLQKEEEPEVAPMDCALGVIAGEQSLHVNRLMAVYAAQLVTDIVVRRQLTTMRVNLSIAPPSVTHVPITRKSLERFDLIKRPR